MPADAASKRQAIGQAGDHRAKPHAFLSLRQVSARRYFSVMLLVSEHCRECNAPLIRRKKAATADRMWRLARRRDAGQALQAGSMSLRSQPKA
jgi:hypothetical protein